MPPHAREAANAPIGFPIILRKVRPFYRAEDPIHRFRSLLPRARDHPLPQIRRQSCDLRRVVSSKCLSCKGKSGYRRPDSPSQEGTFSVSRLRHDRSDRKRVRIRAPDEKLTGLAGLVIVDELVERLGVVSALDAGIGRIKARDRGASAGQLLVGMATAQLTGAASLSGLDTVRRS